MPEKIGPEKKASPCRMMVLAILKIVILFLLFIKTVPLFNHHISSRAQKAVNVHAKADGIFLHSDYQTDFYY